MSAAQLCAQNAARYVRLHLRDKGVAYRALQTGDPLYAAATIHLTPRALARRAKVLANDVLVTTDDLPVHAQYLDAIRSTGASVVQTSRWLNTVMVVADSIQIEALSGLSFVRLVDVVRAHRQQETSVISKTTNLELIQSVATPPTMAEPIECFDGRHGLAEFQNQFMGIDEAHRIGIAGEGVLIGVIDAGFDWRTHIAFHKTRVLDEFDFIYNNSNTANEPEDSLANGSQEDHGTLVLSLIGATRENDRHELGKSLVGGAPKSSFMLAKTEDLRFERHVEEDNFIAGLEWLEAKGVDITNTSLGYTTFDAPERRHSYEELNGRTIPASIAINRATALGVICVVAAGNDGRVGDFMYLGAPGDADSSIAAAAVDSNDQVAGFSSRGMPSHTPLKPDVAAFGVGNWAASPNGPEEFVKAQGTSFAAPMTTSVAALVLSAAPELRPWEVRGILQRSATHSDDPDTAVGYGTIHAGRALRELARTRTVVGVPKVALDFRCVAITAHTIRALDGIAPVLLDTHIVLRWLFGDGDVLEVGGQQPTDGIARWTIPISIPETRLREGAAFAIEIVDARTRTVLRRDSFALTRRPFDTHSTLCARPFLAIHQSADHSILGIPEPINVEAYPNPFASFTRVSFELDSEANVSLDIFNSIGEKVATVIDNERIPPGCHVPIFDARGLPNGAYYARLRIGDELRTGELMFIPH
ncbi:MAG: S8 family peptidase [bacterium]|nr:S8 family peptidase [Candidatus Kapabacteria bacterium]